MSGTDRRTERRTPRPCVEALDGDLAAVWLDAFTDEQVADRVEQRHERDEFWS